MIKSITQNTDDTWMTYAVHNAASTATIAGLSLDILAEKQNTDVTFLPNTGSQQVVRTFEFKGRAFADLFGWSQLQAQSDVDGSTGAYNSNPGTIPRFELGVASAKVPISTAQNEIVITYDVVFYGRAQLASS